MENKVFWLTYSKVEVHVKLPQHARYVLDGCHLLRVVP